MAGVQLNTAGDPREIPSSSAEFQKLAFRASISALSLILYRDQEISQDLFFLNDAALQLHFVSTQLPLPCRSQ